MSTGTQNNGPGHGNNNRNRNTTVNNDSKGGTGASAPPPVSPSSTVNYAAQQAQLRLALAAQLAALRQQAGQARGQYITDRGNIQQERVASQVATEANALQRGIVGSSADLGARAGVDASAAAARVDARYQRNSALGALRLQGIQARTDYVKGVNEIQQAKAAEQTQIAIAEFQADSFDATMQNYAKAYQDALAKLLAGRNAKRDRAAARNANTNGNGHPAWASQLPPGAYVDPQTGDIYTGVGHNRRT